MSEQMSESLAVLSGTYRTDHNGDRPTSFRCHPDDWYKLLSEVSANCSWMGRDRKFMGMVPLLDPKWHRGFPVCLGSKGAAKAIEAGAWQAR